MPKQGRGQRTLILQHGGPNNGNMKYLMRVDPKIKLTREPFFWNTRIVYCGSRENSDGHEHKPGKGERLPREIKSMDKGGMSIG